MCCAVHRHHCAVCYAVPAAPAPGHPGRRGGRVRHHCAVLSAAPAAATCVCRTQLCTVMYNVLKYSLCLALIEFGCVCYAVCLVDVTHAIDEASAHASYINEAATKVLYVINDFANETSSAINALTETSYDVKSLDETSNDIKALAETP